MPRKLDAKQRKLLKLTYHSMKSHSQYAEKLRYQHKLVQFVRSLSIEKLQRLNFNARIKLPNKTICTPLSSFIAFEPQLAVSLLQYIDLSKINFSLNRYGKLLWLVCAYDRASNPLLLTKIIDTVPRNQLLFNQGFSEYELSTPLQILCHRAAIDKQAAALKLILAHIPIKRLDFNKSHKRSSPLYILCNGAANGNRKPLLHVLKTIPNKKLQFNTTNPVAEHYGETPLYQICDAAIRGKLSLLRKIVEETPNHKLNFNLLATDIRGRKETALMKICAAALKKPKPLIYLLKNYPIEMLNFSIVCNAHDVNKNTPLLMLCFVAQKRPELLFTFFQSVSENGILLLRIQNIRDPLMFAIFEYYQQFVRASIEFRDLRTLPSALRRFTNVANLESYDGEINTSRLTLNEILIDIRKQAAFQLASHLLANPCDEHGKNIVSDDGEPLADHIFQAIRLRAYRRGLNYACVAQDEDLKFRFIKLLFKDDLVAINVHEYKWLENCETPEDILNTIELIAEQEQISRMHILEIQVAKLTQEVEELKFQSEQDTSDKSHVSINYLQKHRRSLSADSLPTIRCTIPKNNFVPSC